MQPATFAALLRRHRVEVGLTQEALAEKARLSARAISDLERGVKHTPRKDTVALLAAALELAPAARAAFAAAARRHGAPTESGATGTGTAGDGDTAPPFVGRAHELALLKRHLAGTGPPALFLAGEPGIGKTRLLREAASRAPAYGLRVLEGGCQRRGGQDPYSPLLEAIKGYMRGQSAARLRSDLRGCAWLVRLLPELAADPAMGAALVGALPSWTLPPEQERRLMFDAVGRLLANAAGTDGTLLVLDDLQWAGPDALDLLSTLVRAPDVPVRVVASYRDTDVGPQDPLSGALADLARDGLAARRALAPLDAAEVGELIDGLLARDQGAPGAAAAGFGEDERTRLRERLLRRVGGVPFFVVSYAQGLDARVREGDDSQEDGEDEIPWTVAQGVRQRVAALPELAREALGVAAVIGRVAPPALVTTVVARPEGDVLAALDSASRARLLVGEEQGYRFAHDVIREVVEADVGTGRRMMLHRRVAEALEEAAGLDLGEGGGASVELLAYHYSRSGDADKALSYLERAGDHARDQGAHGAAEGYYRAATERLDARGSSREAARMREKVGLLLITAARYNDALEKLGRAAEAYRLRGDVEGHGRAMALIGRAYAIKGTPHAGIARLRPLLAPLEARGPSHGLAALYTALATLYLLDGRYGEQLAAAERGAALARLVGDERLVAEAEGRRGAALFGLGRTAEALQALEGTILLAERAGDQDVLRRALHNAALAYNERGDFETSRRYIGRTLEIATLEGDRKRIAGAYIERGINLFLRGDWPAARLDFESAAAVSREIGAADGVLHLAYLSLLQGAWDEAEPRLEALRAAALANNNLQDLRQVEGRLAERDLLAGRPEDARARLAPLLDRPAEEHGITWLLYLLAWALLDLGDVAAAADVAGRHVAVARAKGDNLTLVDALWARALVATRQGRPAEAMELLDEGLALARGMSYPHAEGRLLHAYGQLRRATGEPDAARERLEAALTIFRRLGARVDAARVERALEDIFLP